MPSLAQVFRKPVRVTSNDHKVFSVEDAKRKKMDNNNDIVQAFLNHKEVPGWFRGQSNFQIEASNQLLNAIRDDTEQHTTHRVRKCLNVIGIVPVISSKEIKLVMQLSRGNDLAFLWFLLEMHYKTEGPKYTVNEMQIYSAITHLDMMTTIRELDRILPPPQLPKKEIRRQARIATRTAKPRLKPSKSKCVLPYFEKLRYPKPYGKPLTVPRPDFKVSFKNPGTDPNFVIPNETNRWYEKYKMQTGRRIIKRILDENIGNIFDEFKNVTLKESKINSISAKHKAINNLEKNLEDQLKVIAKERCLKHFDTDGRHKEETRKRIVAQLDKDVAMYLCKFRKLADKSRRRTMSQVLASEEEEGSTPKSSASSVEEEDSYSESDSEQRKKNPYVNKENSDNGSKSNMDRALEESIRAERAIEREKEQQRCAKEFKNRRNQAMEDSSDDKTSESSRNVEVKKIKDKNEDDECKELVPRSIVSFEDPAFDKESCKYVQPYDYGHFVPLTPTPSKTYFKAPHEHAPLKFDHRKIFKYNDTANQIVDIRKGFLKELDSKEAELNRLQDVKPEYDNAVRRNVRKLWFKGVAVKRKEMEEEEERVSNIPQKGKNTPLNYDQDYYDPDDKELLHRMLKDGLQYIAKNPKFVLASLPEAEKLPPLREWIYQRYGKLYSPKARYKEFQNSMKIFKALVKISDHIPMPNMSELGNLGNVSYACSNFVRKKAEELRKQYYQTMDANVLELSRNFWFAMRAYICSGGPPRNTYFAYMPASRKDLMHFRVWKPSEFMNAKFFWDMRSRRMRHF